MEILELENHPYYVAVQYHPEYLSRPLNPSPPFLGLVLAAKDRLRVYFSRGCKLSPREPQSDYDSGMYKKKNHFACVNSLVVYCINEELIMPMILLL